MEFELIPYDYHSPLLHDAVKVYCDVWGRDQEDSTAFFRKYARLSDFVGYVARVENKVVGVAFGTISQSGQWWHDKVEREVGRNHQALKNTWVLTELAVLENYRKHNIATRLLETVLSKQPYPNAVLSTQVDNIRARRFYEKRGWTYLHKGFAFQKGRPHYCIMHKDLSRQLPRA